MAKSVKTVSGSSSIKHSTPMVKGGGVRDGGMASKKAGVSSNSGAKFNHLPSSYVGSNKTPAGKGTAATSGKGPQWPHMPSRPGVGKG